MNKKLDINVSVRPDCKLVVIDNNDYLSLSVDMTKHVLIEFASYNDDKFPISDSIKYKQSDNTVWYANRFITEYSIKADGIYWYYKLLIPLLDHFKNSDGKYNISADELFYDGKILFRCNKNFNNESDSIEIKKNSESIDNYITAYNIVHNNEALQTFYAPKVKVFALCKLPKCLISLQKKLLLTNLGNCSFDSCSTNEELRNRRDFLLSAIHVLDYLIHTGNYMEAQRIIDNLSSCNSICEDELGISKNDCGCGTFI